MLVEVPVNFPSVSPDQKYQDLVVMVIILVFLEEEHPRASLTAYLFLGANWEMEESLLNLQATQVVLLVAFFLAVCQENLLVFVFLG